ncbi:hypothetical protein BP6252_00076 [Coleophoma cylindrospora]|uniref:Uncharacterized protein n=1 Tax=Coleophoma cylindrospora TaxID=1849047 RepID=A0A3D8SPD7_9HELO|nr:hypothetical protein BP6252_00076 [Coleophoma cylindrospora]
MSQSSRRDGSEEDQVHDLPFPASVITRFALFLTSGIPPNNVKTTLPLLAPEDIQALSSNYSTWAPAPFSQLPGAPLIRIASHISGLHDLVRFALTKNDMGRSEKAMKSRIWEGIAPISEARWRAKGLDDRANIGEAIGYLKLVVDVFKHFSQPNIQGQMREINNTVCAELDTFQDALKAVRQSKGEEAPTFNVMRLWQEYIKLQFGLMTVQARSWLFIRLKSLYTSWKNVMLEKFQGGRILSDTHGTVLIDHQAIAVLNQLLDLYQDAEYYLRIRSEGYFLPQGVHAAFANAGNQAPEVTNRIYEDIERARRRDYEFSLKQVLDQRVAQRRTSMPVPDFLESMSMVVDREFVQKGLQQEIENPLIPQVEPWVYDLQNKVGMQRFGFVAYRISYKESDEDWATFITKFESGLNSGWEGVLGADTIKGKAYLQWIDGKKEGLPEGDFAAVQNHFKSFSKSDMLLPGLDKTVCLALDAICISSFANTRAGDRKGDYRGFVTAIDCNSSDNGRRPLPRGYEGHVKIIDQLIWTDLYAQIAARHAQNLIDFWGLAARHPWAVYIGPTVGVRRKKWREMRDVLETMLKGWKDGGRNIPVR